MCRCRLPHLAMLLRDADGSLRTALFRYWATCAHQAAQSMRKDGVHCDRFVTTIALTVSLFGGRVWVSTMNDPTTTAPLT